MDVFVLLKKEYLKKSHAAVPLNMEDVTFYILIDIFRYQKIGTCPVVLTYSKLSEALNAVKSSEQFVRYIAGG